MDILKTAVEWAKAEMFSSLFFVAFGLLFLIGSVGFWQLGKTEVAKAFIVPTLVASILLLLIGFGLYFTNKSRAASFPTAYQTDQSAFITEEIDRAEKTLDEYQLIVFKIIPLIIVVAALGIIFLSSPMWRAICITTIAMMIVILLIDSNANTRIKNYHQQLLEQKL